MNMYFKKIIYLLVHKKYNNLINHKDLYRKIDNHFLNIFFYSKILKQ